MSEKKEIEFRELNSGDIFLISEIGDAADIDLKEIGIGEGGNSKEVGLAMVYAVFRKLHKAKKQVNNFLASLTGLKPAEIDKMNLLEYKELLEKLKKLDGLMELFKPAGE